MLVYHIFYIQYHIFSWTITNDKLRQIMTNIICRHFSSVVKRTKISKENTHSCNDGEGYDFRQSRIGHKPTHISYGPHHTWDVTRQACLWIDTWTVLHVGTVDDEISRGCGKDSTEMTEDIVQTLSRKFNFQFLESSKMWYGLCCANAAYALR